MTPETRPAARFEPLHDAHAIDQALFAVQFAQPLDDGTFQQAIDVTEPYSGELPSKQDFPGFPGLPGIPAFNVPMFPVGVAVPALAGQLGILSGGGILSSPGQQTPPPPTVRIMRSIRRDGTTENELKVERSSVSFRTTAYEGWDITWGKVSNYFRELLPIYATTATVASIGLTYVDKFVWTGAIETCLPSLLLRDDSIYVSPYVYDITELWHNHTGHFIRASNVIKRLLNVNVDYIEENVGQTPRRVVGITTVVTDLLNQPTYDQLDLHGASLEDFCVGQITQLHGLSKQVFGRVINDAMCNRIGLTE